MKLDEMLTAIKPYVLDWINHGRSSAAPIILTNPDLSAGAVLFTHTPQPFSINVADSAEACLFDLRFANSHTTTTSQFYGIKIQTDAEAVDTAAGIAVFNIGRADAVYIDVAGKAGNAAGNAPTGIGIDVNKSPMTTAEHSSANSSQQGIQIFDWSTTNQGIGGPRGMLLNKIGNLNTDHLLMTLRTNRHALQMVVNAADAGFDGNQIMVMLADESSGQYWWRIRATGDQVFEKDGAGIQWITPGNKSAYILASGNDLKLKSGGTGIRFVNQADSNTGLLVQDNCDVVIGLAGTTSASAGFLHVPAPAGTPIGVPVTYTGWLPMAYDRINNILYVYNGSWKGVALT